MSELIHGEVVEKLRKAMEMFELPGATVIVDKAVLKEAIDAIEDLNTDVDEWIRIFDMLNDRENRHKYLDWWRKQNDQSDLAYPDGDQIYKDFWHLMKIAKKMHLWIFHNTFDEQKAYDECGLTDEDNAMLGYASLTIKVGGEEAEDVKAEID